MSELKTVDHSSEALVVLQSQVPIVVDSYLNIKVGDVFQKELQIHTADLIHKYSLHHFPKLTKKLTPTAEQEFEKSPSDILKIKKEQAEESLIQLKDHKRKHDDDEDDDDEDPPAGPNQGKKTKRRRTKESKSSKKPSTTKETPKGKSPTKGSKTGKSASIKEPVEEPIAEVVMDDADDDVAHDDYQPQDTLEPKIRKTLMSFIQPPRPPTLDLEWIKRQVVLDQPKQLWFNQMVSATKDPPTINDLMPNSIDFSKYVLNRLKSGNLTQDILLGPAYNLLKGTCSSSIELKYHFQECFNALTDMLDWNNTEGDCYPFDLSKPLPLHGHPGHLTVGANYFFNNDLEYQKSSDSERTYTTSITKTKVARYEIEERQKIWHRSQLNKFSKHNVYSTKKIMVVKSVSVKKLHGYGYLEEIVVKRANCQLYKFKEGDFMDLHMNDIEDMLLLVVQHKLFHLTDSDIIEFIVALQIEFKEPYTPSHKPPGVIYEDLVQQKRLISDGTLKKVRDELHHRVLDFDLGYNKEMEMRKWTATDKKRFALMVELVDKQMRERRIIRNLERLVSARELEMDYKLMTHTT
ncbi:hypothetical protein Tco_0242422 [Tanacetum coccineum]